MAKAAMSLLIAATFTLILAAGASAEWWPGLPLP
jgi:hypothetical protein